MLTTITQYSPIYGGFILQIESASQRPSREFDIDSVRNHCRGSVLTTEEHLLAKSSYSCFGYVEDSKWQRVETNYSEARFHLSTHPSTWKQNVNCRNKVKSSNKCEKAVTNHCKNKENVLLCLFCEYDTL